MRHGVTALEVDVAVIGAGFGGSLTALILDRIGLRVALLDRGRHPRFAIGESSTPVADLVLTDLASRYDLPRLAPLARYGTWLAARPELRRGAKRGFSYFSHQPGAPFTPAAGRGTELLVAASLDDDHADTHWYRADVDGFIAAEAERAGIPYFDRTEVAVERRGPAWRITGRRAAESVRIGARFLVDASGEAMVLPRTLGLPDATATLRTRSRAVFSHVEDLVPWTGIYRAAGGDSGPHPFDPDRSALHQVLDRGWMWQLRFDHGVTSAGFAIDLDRAPLDPSLPPETEWATLLGAFPSLATQFAPARIADPPGAIRRSGRLQRRAGIAAGEDWALLPHTAGFVDPLHSTGIGHTLAGVERLAGILAAHWGRASLGPELARYDRILGLELSLIDDLVSACYATLDRFDLFIAAASLYFAAATSWEHRRLDGTIPPGGAFLLADDAEWRTTVERVRSMLAHRGPETRDTAATYRWVAGQIAPWNAVGLLDPDAANLHRATAPERPV